MVAADPVAVPVAARDDYVEFVVAQFRPGCHRQRPAMQRVHAVGVEVARQVGGAPDPANGKYLVRLQPQLGTSPLDAV